jgi:hypothetical protein
MVENSKSFTKAVFYRVSRVSSKVSLHHYHFMLHRQPTPGRPIGSPVGSDILVFGPGLDTP